MNPTEVAELKAKLDTIFDDAVYIGGMEPVELNQKIRELYVSDQAAGVPFAITRAKMLDYFLQNMRIAINGIGKFAGIAERNSLARQPGSEIKCIQSERPGEIARVEFPEEYEEWQNDFKNGWYYPQMDLSHTSPDWDRILTLGIPGLLQLAEEKYAENNSVFYESVKIVYTAFRNFTLRFARLANQHGREDLGNVLSGLADHAPETLQEALQLSILYWNLQEIEGEWVRSLGVFDRQYMPFLEKDLASGRLDEDSAEELIIHYFSFYHAESKGTDAGCAICFGGLLPGEEQKDGYNLMTRLSWSAFRKLGNPTPKFSMRWNPNTPDEWVNYAAECIREGQNAMVFANEPVVREAFLRRGKEKGDLHNFVPIGCYEPAIMGKELSCTMSCTYNIAKGVEAIFDDKTFHPQSYEEVEERYFQLLGGNLKRALEITSKYEKIWNRINPSPVLSGTMLECMERGLDVTEYGTKYSTSGVPCTGIGTAVDALMAIKTMVFDRKMVSFEELGTILEGNWADHEDLRQFALKRTPKWGCGNPDADTLAQKICDFAANLINHTPNVKGGTYQMGLWSIYYCLTFGNAMKATADGRFEKTGLSKNSGCTAGCDTEGVAGLFESLSRLDHAEFPDGAILDITLPSRTVAGPEGNDFLVNLIKTYFACGGMFIHFNILSAEQLKDAQVNPEKYRNLQVRLCGWNVRFVDLNKQHQDWLIHEVEGAK